MTNRMQKVKELMESFQMLHRSTKFSPPGFDDSAPVTPSQLRVLMVLEERNGSSLKEIAQTLGITSSAATQLVDGLVVNGYVIRKEDPMDRRKMTITISDKSKKQIEKMKQQGISQFLELFEALSDEEFDQFLSLHMKVVESFAKKNHI